MLGLRPPVGAYMALMRNVACAPQPDRVMRPQGGRIDRGADRRCQAKLIEVLHRELQLIVLLILRPRRQQIVNQIFRGFLERAVAFAGGSVSRWMMPPSGSGVFW